MTSSQKKVSEVPLDSEVSATAKQLLPLVVERLDSDPAWALGMLQALTSELGGETEHGKRASAVTASALVELSPASALAIAHDLAQGNELARASAMAKFALSEPNALGDKVTNARVLYSSLLERQGLFSEAARAIGDAVRCAPDDESVQSDRSRILDATRKELRDRPPANNLERIAMLATLVQEAGWNRADVMLLVRLSAGLLIRKS
ncbi:MAG: hypothetical protein AAF250_08315 [Pseudomonadota bacterium]